MRLALLAALALVLATPAAASRAPPVPERRAIELAVRFFPGVGRNHTVRVSSVRISTVDPHYAYARVFAREPLGQPIGPADWLFRLRPIGWRVVWFGTTAPLCRVAPAAVRLDLLGSTRCRAK